LQRMYLNMSENMVANGEHEKISIGRVLVSVSTPLQWGGMGGWGDGMREYRGNKKSRGGTKVGSCVEPILGRPKFPTIIHTTTPQKEKGQRARSDAKNFNFLVIIGRPITVGRVPLHLIQSEAFVWHLRTEACALCVGALSKRRAMKTHKTMVAGCSAHLSSPRPPIADSTSTDHDCPT